MLASQIPHFDGVFMHSCLMGNMESLVDLYPISDYTISCMHPLNSDGGSMVSLVKELLKGADFPTTTKAVFKDIYDEDDKGYKSAKCNGDINLLDNKEFGNLLPICKKLSSRLLTLYPDKKTEINKAIENDIYVGHPDYIGDAGLTHSFQTAYEYTNFHKQTGWGDWLNKLEAKPTTDNPAGDKKSE